MEKDFLTEDWKKEKPLRFTERPAFVMLLIVACIAFCVIIGWLSQME